MTLLPILALVATLIPSPNPTKVDVNGDNVPDRIGLGCPRGGSSYTLTVNDATYVGRGEVLEGTFSIVDVDSTDSCLEIAVPQEGPSDDYATYLHSYDGTSIRFLGVLPGTSDLKVDGSGRVATSCRGRVLQTWFYPCVYQLDPDRSVHKVDQELYPMGTQCRLKIALPLQASRSDSSVVAVPGAGQSVVIEASDDAAWCLVRTSEGVWGWFRLTRYNTVVPLGLDASHVFEGLTYAD